jgi:hypothetical protein
VVIQITDDTITLEMDNHVVATARFSEDAVADAMARGPSRLTLPGCPPASRRLRR